MLKRKKKNQGFTLIEVMIALFVLSVGLLGSSAMILRGQQEAVRTNYNGTAHQLAQSMAEMMRSNITAVNAGDYNNLDSHAADPGCITTGCNTTEMATYDSFIWGWMLDEYLPGAIGTVRGNGTDTIFTITISYTEIERKKRSEGEEVTRNHVMVFQP